MKAIRVHEFGEPEKMRLEEVTDPSCGPGQVLVKIHAIGINHPLTKHLPEIMESPRTDTAEDLKNMKVIQSLPNNI